MSLCIPRRPRRSLWYLVLLLPAGFLTVEPAASDDTGVTDPPAPTELPWNAAYDLELDSEQGYTQRVVADLGESRWVWWASGDLVLTRDEPAPAGMVEREYYLHNPLEGTSHRVGVSAGPVVFGPVLIRGGYRRVMDPSGGGVVPSAIIDATAVRLDGAREPSSWDGAAVSTNAQNSPVGAIGADAGVAYLYNADRAHIALGHIGIAPADARFGRLSVFGSAAEVLEGGRSIVRDHRDEAWFRDTPHPQDAVIRGLAVSYRLERGGDHDEGGLPLPVLFLVDGLRQGHSWRPRRHAGQVFARVGPPRIRVALRGVAVETGFLDADLSAPARAAFRGFRVEGRERVPTLREENRPSLTWNGEFEAERRWDDGLPAPLQRYRRYGLVFRSGGVLSQCGAELERPDDEWTVSAALSTPERWGLPVAGRVSAEHRWSVHNPDRRIALESSLRRTVSAATGSGSRRTALRWRVVGETPATAGAGNQYVWDHFVVVEVPVGEAAAVSVHLGVAGAATDNVEYTGALRIHWAASGLWAPATGAATAESTGRE
ncbi:MAG: hypothetical protein PF508_16495 [Spirochaeta sp.]|jgi:hypothetical protein|nr:hypothetical protein [Spirochaeta sp.]